MYNPATLLAAFRGLIGLRPSHNAQHEAARLDADLTVSASGQFADDLHPLFSAENFANAIAATEPYFVAPYDAQADYQPAAVVLDALDRMALYRAVANSTGAALTDPTKWKPTTLLSVWFRNLYDSAVLEVAQALSAQKRAVQPARTLQNNTPLYVGDALRSNTVPKSGRFVGFLIELREASLVATLQRIGLQLSAAVPVTLYVFHSSQSDPIATIEVTPTAANRFHYQDVSLDAGPLTLDNEEGFYTIGYYEDDLGAASALRLINYVFNPGGCSGCHASDMSQRARWSSFVSVRPMATTYTTQGVMDFAKEDMAFELDTNYGLNLTLSFQCDLTAVLVSQKETFQTALLACLRYRLLDALAASARNSQQADQIAILAYNQSREWDDPMNPRKLYQKAIKELDLNLSGLSGLCFPSAARAGIRSRVIG